MIIELVDKASTRTSRGILSKAWYRLDGKLVLVKGNSVVDGHIGYEPFSEVMASHIAKVLGIEHVPYILLKSELFPEVKVFGIDMVSVCPYYIPDGAQAMSFYNYIVSMLGDEPKDYFDAYKRFLDPKSLYNMLVFDALIGNEDRHENNFDVIRTVLPDGSVYDKMSPLYDSGASLLAWRKDSELGLAGIVGRLDKSKPFRTKHSAQIKLVPEPVIPACNIDSLYRGIISSIEPILGLLPVRRAEAIKKYIRWRMKYLAKGMG